MTWTPDDMTTTSDTELLRKACEELEEATRLTCETLNSVGSWWNTDTAASEEVAALEAGILNRELEHAKNYMEDVLNAMQKIENVLSCRE